MGNSASSFNSANSFRGREQRVEYFPSLYDGREVCLNIYDLSADLSLANTVVFDLLRVGGAFHGGVEVFGREWSFGVDGVQKGSPRWHDFHVYRETIRMGKTNLDPEGVVRLISEMMDKWRGVTYDFFQRNCCSFCNELCQRLGVGPIPDWVERLAKAAGRTLQVLEEAATALGLESPRQGLRRAFADNEDENGSAEECGGYYELQDEEGRPQAQQQQQQQHYPGAPWEIPDEVLDAVAASWLEYRQEWGHSQEYPVHCPPGPIPGSGFPSQQRSQPHYIKQNRVVDKLGVTTKSAMKFTERRGSWPEAATDEDQLSTTHKSLQRSRRSASFVVGTAQDPTATTTSKVVHQTKIVHQAPETTVRQLSAGNAENTQWKRCSSFAEVHHYVPHTSSMPRRGGSFIETHSSGFEPVSAVRGAGGTTGWSATRMPKGFGATFGAKRASIPCRPSSCHDQTSMGCSPNKMACQTRWV